MQTQIQENLDKIDKMMQNQDSAKDLKSRPLKITYIDFKTGKRTEDNPSKKSTAAKPYEVINFTADQTSTFTVMEQRNKIFLKRYIVEPDTEPKGIVVLLCNLN